MTMQPEPIWLTYARSYLGTMEQRDDNIVRGWALALGGFIASMFAKAGSAHTVPWCGLFVDSMLSKASMRTPGQKILGALNWQGWGQGLTKGTLGAVLVFQRPGGGHVGFYVGEDEQAYHVLGGNQGDKVSITRIAKARCVAIRWPNELPANPKPVMLASNGTPLSTNEA